MFSFFSDGVRQNVSGHTLCIRAKRPDNMVVLDMGEVTADGKAVYEVKSNVYCIPGKVALEVALATESGTYVTTKELIVTVREGHGNGDLTAENTTPIIAKLTEQSARAQRAADAANKIAGMDFAVKMLDGSAEPTATKTDDGERVVLELGIPQGEKGADGYTPVKGIDYFDGKDGLTESEVVDVIRANAQNDIHGDRTLPPSKLYVDEAISNAIGVVLGGAS